MLNAHPVICQYDGNNIETSFKMNVFLHDISIGSTDQEGLLLLVHEYLGFAEIERTPCFNLCYYEAIVVYCNDVDLIFVVIPVLLQDVESFFQDQSSPK